MHLRPFFKVEIHMADSDTDSAVTTQLHYFVTNCCMQIRPML